MFARKKIENHDTEEDPQVLANCNATENSKQKEAMIKDCLLIELALETDKIIVSLDETAREAFRKASQSVADLRNILPGQPDTARREGTRMAGEQLAQMKPTEDFASCRRDKDIRRGTWVLGQSANHEIPAFSAQARPASKPHLSHMLR